MNSNTNSPAEARPSDRPEWMSRAKPVEGVRVDIAFFIAKSFYYGPENGYSKKQWDQLREPLYQPGGERYGDFLLSAELKDSAAELIRYVLRLVARHRKDIAQQSVHTQAEPESA